MTDDNFFTAAARFRAACIEFRDAVIVEIESALPFLKGGMVKSDRSFVIGERGPEVVIRGGHRGCGSTSQNPPIGGGDGSQSNRPIAFGDTGCQNPSPPANRVPPPPPPAPPPRKD